MECFSFVIYKDNKPEIVKAFLYKLSNLPLNSFSSLSIHAPNNFISIRFSITDTFGFEKTSDREQGTTSN